MIGIVAGGHGRATGGPRVCVVLAGGEGRRMGGGKALRRLGSTTLGGRALDLARGYAGAVAVAVRHDRQMEDTGDAVVILDDPAIPGPLAGLASAIAHARTLGAQRVLTIACDMPRLPPDLFERLEAALDREPDVRVAVAASRARLHPVCALWPTDAAAELAAYAAAGRASLRGFAADLGHTVVEWDARDGDPFVNVNTPADLAALQTG